MKIISGGQTGVDRAALDVAIELGIPHGGWCPLGRRAEDGRIPDVYQLTETASDGYPERTRRNVREANATLLIFEREMTGGTWLTWKEIELAERERWLCDLRSVDMRIRPDVEINGLRRWIAKLGPEAVLNVAGPRESKEPGIYAATRSLLLQVLS